MTATDLTVKSRARIWRIHVSDMQEADRPWEVPDHEEALKLQLLTVDGLAGFTAVVSSSKPETGVGVGAIHPSMWSRISEKGVNSCTLTC